MSNLAEENVSSEEASKILNREWKNVQSDDQTKYIDNDLVRTKIKEVLTDSNKTYRYILVNAALSKAVNPNIHYRALQAGSSLGGAYDARSVAHDALVPWEKGHGERLGGSPEPFVNNPARHPEVDTSNRARSSQKQERLYKLLQRMQEQVEEGELDPTDILRQTLQAVSELESKTVEFESPSDAPYDVIALKIREYLRESGNGERLPAVVAGIMQTYYEHAGEGDWRVDCEHANVSDEFSKAAGDVEIFYNDELHKAMEVKDKPATQSSVQHAIEKGRINELGEYLYVLGAGFKPGEEGDAHQEAEDAPIELIFITPDELISSLKLVDDVERVFFLEAVGKFLNDMRANQSNKTAFTEMVESIK
ncbi:restriction endonuclease, SacI family [Natronomonas sp. LN261]|uniref:restriction endonuclease, SacI family n=1 Tax=Natronomonas sp. LN261 TaxID=2750669 RepID=UPI0015EE5765